VTSSGGETLVVIFPAGQRMASRPISFARRRSSWFLRGPGRAAISLYRCGAGFEPGVFRNSADPVGSAASRFSWPVLKPGSRLPRIPQSSQPLWPEPKARSQSLISRAPRAGSRFLIHNDHITGLLPIGQVFGRASAGESFTSSDGGRAASNSAVNLWLAGSPVISA